MSLGLQPVYWKIFEEEEKRKKFISSFADALKISQLENKIKELEEKVKKLEEILGRDEFDKIDENILDHLS